MTVQHITEDGQKRTLKAFADSAMEYLDTHLEYDEVVQLADHIIELEKDRMTHPDQIYPLRDRYEYNFSGFFGQVIGVGRPGVGEKHKKEGG